MGGYYAAHAERLGFSDEVATIRHAWQSGDRLAAVRAVSDGMIAACTLGSEADTASRRIARLVAEGIQVPVASFPHGCSEAEIAESIDRLAADLLR
jgi:hypothetical protein